MIRSVREIFGGAMMVCRLKDLDRLAQQSFEHVGHAQCLARCIGQRHAGGVQRRLFEVDRFGVIGRGRRIGKQPQRNGRKAVCERKEYHKSPVPPLGRTFLHGIGLGMRHYTAF